MDFWKAIGELHAERQRLNKLIASLEPLSGKGKRQRGRKGMSEEERSVVSERMRKYWEARRQQASVTTD